MDDGHALAEVHEAIRNISHCMDLREVADFRRESSAKEAAVALKEVLDRIELPKEKNIPDREAMKTDDGLPIEMWTIPNTEITFRLIKEGPNKGSYPFSPDTVNRATEFIQRVKHLPYKKGATEGFARRAANGWLTWSSDFRARHGNERMARRFGSGLAWGWFCFLPRC